MVSAIFNTSIYITQFYKDFSKKMFTLLFCSFFKNQAHVLPKWHRFLPDYIHVLEKMICNLKLILTECKNAVLLQSLLALL